MSKNLIAKVEIIIKAPINKVWKALTSPELIKQYLFGTETVTDWKVGSPVIWKGVWQGKTYEDKGEIIRIVPVETTYWSSMSGLSDSPLNYKKVTYELTKNNGNTKLTLIQDNNPTEEDKSHSEQNWIIALEGMKKLLEK
jgi:uncharacterized protein YndB with AHSA1/START domain